jgi:hypothetical protein
MTLGVKATKILTCTMPKIGNIQQASSTQSTKSVFHRNARALCPGKSKTNIESKGKNEKQIDSLPTPI